MDTRRRASEKSRLFARIKELDGVEKKGLSKKAVEKKQDERKVVGLVQKKEPVGVEKKGLSQKAGEKKEIGDKAAARRKVVAEKKEQESKATAAKKELEKKKKREAERKAAEKRDEERKTKKEQEKKEKEQKELEKKKKEAERKDAAKKIVDAKRTSVYAKNDRALNARGSKVNNAHLEKTTKPKASVSLVKQSAGQEERMQQMQRELDEEKRKTEDMARRMMVSVNYNYAMLFPLSSSTVIP